MASFLNRKVLIVFLAISFLFNTREEAYVLYEIALLPTMGEKTQAFFDLCHPNRIILLVPGAISLNLESVIFFVSGRSSL